MDRADPDSLPGGGLYDVLTCSWPYPYLSALHAPCRQLELLLVGLLFLVRARLPERQSTENLLSDFCHGALPISACQASVGSVPIVTDPVTRQDERGMPDHPRDDVRLKWDFAPEPGFQA